MKKLRASVICVAPIVLVACGDPIISFQDAAVLRGEWIGKTNELFEIFFTFSALDPACSNEHGKQTCTEYEIAGTANYKLMTYQIIGKASLGFNRAPFAVAEPQLNAEIFDENRKQVGNISVIRGCPKSQAENCYSGFLFQQQIEPATSKYSIEMTLVKK